MKYILIILFSFLINSVKSQDYFEQYQQLADSFEVVYGIPSSVIMGVAYYESGGGRSQLARYSNNHFGIKGYNPKYRSSFRYFESDTASYKGFCELISQRKFYEKLKGNENPKDWIMYISRSGYAGGSSTWGPRIIAIINRHKLT
jgi:flagellum-specific peptidoglycan hydrolase FlgJ